MSSQNFGTFHWSNETEADVEAFQIKGRTLFFLLAIFTLIIFFTILFLCAHWIFRNRNIPGSTNNVSSQTPRFYSRSQGLDPDAIKKLPIILYQKSHSNRATDCCICLSAFGDGDKLKVLPECEHCFHCECVDAWLVNHSNCPLCRGSLKLDLIRDDSVIEHSPIVALDASLNSITDSSVLRILIQEPPIRYNSPL